MATLAELTAALAAATDPRARVEAHIALATELARTGHAKRAVPHAQAARDLAATLSDSVLAASAVHALARCHFYLAEFVPALELLLEAARRYQENGDLANAATALAGVGLCQHRLGAQEDAVASLLRALESARDQGFVTLEINVHNSLASALMWSGRADEAAQHIATGTALARAQGNRNLLTKLVHNESLIAKRRGDDATDPAAAAREYEAGLVLSEQALSLARELGNRYDEAHSLGQSGTMLRLLGRAEASEAALTQTLALGKELDETHVQAEALLELGRLRAGRGDAAAARAAFNEAIDMSSRINAKALIADACEAMSGALEKDGDAAGALALYKRFHAVRAEEFRTTRQHAARAAQLWIDFQQATRQVTRYREEAQLLAEDKKALAQQAEVLAAESQQDPLTGLLNRRGLDLQIGAILTASEVNKLPLTIALIDIDRFKAINDLCSHPVGDAVLKRVASVIRAQCRAGDLPVRFGGDEFLLVLAGADATVGLRVLQRLKREVDGCAWHAEAYGLKVTLSIGAATRLPGATIAATIAIADRALYDAKAGGRDRIVVAPVSSA